MDFSGDATLRAQAEDTCPGMQGIRRLPAAAFSASEPSACVRAASSNPFWPAWPVCESASEAKGRSQRPSRSGREEEAGRRTYSFLCRWDGPRDGLEEWACTSGWEGEFIVGWMNFGQESGLDRTGQDWADRTGRVWRWPRGFSGQRWRGLPLDGWTGWTPACLRYSKQTSAAPQKWGHVLRANSDSLAARTLCTVWYLLPSIGLLSRWSSSTGYSAAPGPAAQVRTSSITAARPAKGVTFTNGELPSHPSSNILRLPVRLPRHQAIVFLFFCSRFCPAVIVHCHASTRDITYPTRRARQNASAFGCEIAARCSDGGLSTLPRPQHCPVRPLHRMLPRGPAS